MAHQHKHTINTKPTNFDTRWKHLWTKIQAAQIHKLDQQTLLHTDTHILSNHSLKPFTYTKESKRKRNFQRNKNYVGYDKQKKKKWNS